MPEPALGPLAAALAETVERSRTARVELGTLRDQAFAVDLSLAGDPEARARIAAAIEELRAAELIVVPAGRDGWDTAIAPRLPRWVRRPVVPRSPRPIEAPAVTWHASLGWAAGGTWTRDERRVLRRINDWLVAGGGAEKVPIQERSLELLGDEKALTALLRGPLFAEGRLDLDLLGAVRSSAPFVYTKTGTGGPYALILENSATYRSVLASVPADSPVGLVVFGGGNGFVRSIEYFAELATSGVLNSPIRHLRYFGDLDAEGLRIPVNAGRVAAELGLPPVLPALGLYRRLLIHGRPAPDEPVEPEAALALAGWLPDELADRVVTHLVAGERLAQEAVGRDLLRLDSGFASIEELGRPVIARPVVMRAADLPAGAEAVARDDTGVDRSPATDEDWDAWVSAGRTRNHALGDPLLDWLRRYGADAGFVPDTERDGYDPRADFAAFVMRKGAEFEAGVMRLLSAREGVTRIGGGWEDARSAERAADTIAAMRAGVPIIAQGVLRNPARQTYGMPDLLVRSDVLARLFPTALDYEEAHQGAPGLGLDHVHYRVVDIKFHTFELLADGSAAGDAGSLPYLVQVWLYNEALGRVSGATPPAGYLLGRNWTAGDERGTGCLERLARVDAARYLPRRDAELGDLAAEAVNWVRRMRADGRGWVVLPRPSVPELYPHMRNTEDAPWHGAKAEIAAELRELTLLPRMNPRRRADAIAIGIDRWDHPLASAQNLGVTEPAGAAQLDAVLVANRSPVTVVLPKRITRAPDVWRTPGILEFYVDFETTSSLDDTFEQLPEVGGQPLVFQIGCGHWQAGTLCVAQWTAARIDPVEEGRIIGAWLDHMAAVVATAGAGLESARIVHWSPAEPVNLESAYNSARTRHPNAAWPTTLPWFDFLLNVIRVEPVTVTGAFNFGLKSIAKALHAAGLIETTWADGPTDGLGAMIGAWWCDAEARRLGVPMIELPLMGEIAAYNGVDVRVMADVVRFLRENR